MLPPFVPPSARAASERLPSIIEFVIDPSAAGTGGTAVAEHETETLPSIDSYLRSIGQPAYRAPGAEPLISFEPEPESRYELPNEDAVVNEGKESAEAWGAAASGDGIAAHAPEPVADTWVAEERDSFDWQGAAALAAPPDEERRASEEWSSTQWDGTAGAGQEYIAGLLAQIARRVRSGELRVQGGRNMSPEAALAAVLAALLAEPEGSEG